MARESFSMIPNWLRDELEAGRLTPAAIATFFVIASHSHAASGEGANPTKETIAKETGQSTKTVGRHLDALAQVGALRWTHRRRRSGGKYASNEYVITTGARLTMGHHDPTVHRTPRRVRPRDTTTPRSMGHHDPTVHGTSRPHGPWDTTTPVTRPHSEQDPNTNKTPLLNKTSGAVVGRGTWSVDEVKERLERHAGFVPVMDDDGPEVDDSEAQP